MISNFEQLADVGSRHRRDVLERNVFDFANGFRHQLNVCRLIALAVMR